MHCPICNKEYEHFQALNAHKWRAHTDRGQKHRVPGWLKGRKMSDPKWGFRNPERFKKSIETKLSKRTFAGPKNPNWKGGGFDFKSQSGWKATRRIIWERDKLCRVCGLPPNLKRRFDVHHIRPRRQGGTDELSNLIGLHHSCHMQVEAGKLSLGVGNGTA